MTAIVSELVDITAGSATIAAIITTVFSKRQGTAQVSIGKIQQGSSVRFYGIVE